jgi:hypothetical protein
MTDASKTIENTLRVHSKLTAEVQSKPGWEPDIKLPSKVTDMDAKTGTADPHREVRILY